MRYTQFSAHLKEKFGAKVYKITLDAGFSCPNRDGAISTGGCIFCDDFGSFSNSHSNLLSIEDQVENGVVNLREKFKAEKFMSYFQAYSNTYKPAEELKSIYDSALRNKDVVGLSIGTRPDCLDDAKIELIDAYSKDYYTWIELGLQSVHDKTLKLINRGHDFSCFDEVIKKLKKTQIKTCAHVILGLPGETKDDMLKTARYIADIGVDGVKFHALCVLKNTELEKMYNNGEVPLLSEEEYVETVCDFLEILPPETTIHRVAGNGLKEIQIAPSWLNNKFKTLNAVDKELEKRDTRQGSHYCKVDLSSKSF